MFTSKIGMFGAMLGCLIAFAGNMEAQEMSKNAILEKIQLNRDHPEVLAELLPIVRGCFTPSKYERILLTKLRDKNTPTKDFRQIADIIGELLACKVVECLATTPVKVETPVTSCEGEVLANRMELVSIMRSGDALLDVFKKHFPGAHISKFWPSAMKRLPNLISSI